MSDTLYSACLLLAMVAVTVAWAVWLGRHSRLGRSREAAWRRRQGRLAGAAVALTAVSLAIHLPFGHPPGSARALPPAEFVAEHRAMVWVALAGIAALLGAWRALGRDRGGTS